MPLDALTQDDTIDAMVETVLAQAPPRFALAGYSMGGIVALHLAARAPERLSHLVILNSTARPDPPERRIIRDEQMARAQAGGLEAVVETEFMPLYFAPGPTRPTTLEGLVRAMARHLGPAIFCRQMRALRDRSDARPLLPGITCPTLVLGAAHDALCSVDRHREMADSLPNARLHILEEAGHMAPLEAPTAMAAQISEFLDA
ncbi:hydrolase [Niveispirillum cyanobacteriorum]|nr:hydrolase [Niveispirillum cyanobacteriorum]